MPYVGRDRAGVFIATGFATDGLVYGTLAASVIADQIAGRANPLASVLDATRELGLPVSRQPLRARRTRA